MRTRPGGCYVLPIRRLSSASSSSIWFAAVARTWADDNRLTYQHPLSAALPAIGRWLDMPYAEMPGDLFTPRMQFGSSAASERMVVSPGREAEGIMQMPTGQSGHPLSPFYGAGHEDWANGRPTLLLPGTTQHTLTLQPLAR